MKRRDFIALTSGLPLVAAAPAAAQKESKPTAPAPKKLPPQIPPLPVIPGPSCLRAGPMLGHIGESEASLWINATQPSKWSIEIADNPDFSQARTERTSEDRQTPAIHPLSLSRSVRRSHRLRASLRIICHLTSHRHARQTARRVQLVCRPASATDRRRLGRDRFSFGFRCVPDARRQPLRRYHRP